MADAQGVASFELVRGRACEEQAFVWAFDLLELDCENLRDLPLERRKGELKALLKCAPFGLALNECIDGDGPALFAQACAVVRGHRLEAAEFALSVAPLAALAQGE